MLWIEFYIIKTKWQLIVLLSPSLFLFKLGLAPQIQDLYGKAKFTGKFVHVHVLTKDNMACTGFLFRSTAHEDLFCYHKNQHMFLPSEEQISAMRKELEKYGIQMPAFSKIGGILESEV